MFFPHQRHNQAWQRADQLLPLRFSEEPAPRRTHPWQVIPAWTGRRARWTASLEPGLVNGIPAAMRVRVRELTAGQRARVEQDLLAQGRRLPEENARVDVFLDERPAVDLLWRRIGTGAQGTVREQDGELVVQQEPVPEFFKRLGVQDASTSALGYEATATQGVRYLAASDLVLNQPRVSVQTQVVVESAIGGSLTSVVPVYRVPPDLQAHVVVFPKFQPPEPPTLTPRDVFFNPFQDLPLDQLHLATVYALSPWNPPMEDIDGNWTIYVHHRVHWNVAHATRIPETARAERLTLFTGLAAGIGDTLFNFILSNNNDFTQAALNLATSSRTQGRMYAV